MFEPEQGTNREDARARRLGGCAGRVVAVASVSRNALALCRRERARLGVRAILLYAHVRQSVHASRGIERREMSGRARLARLERFRVESRGRIVGVFFLDAPEVEHERHRLRSGGRERGARRCGAPLVEEQVRLRVF